MNIYRIGQLTQRISIERRHKRPDGAGGFEQFTQPVCSCWAYVRQLSARESQQAEKTTASAQCVFVIRNRQDLKESYTIIHDGNAYNIRSLPPRNSRDLFMEIIAERGAV